MEKIVLLLCVTQFITAALGMAGVVLVTTERRKRAETPETPTKKAETQAAETAMDEAKKAAAEAQRLYEEGFVNLMQYDGRPRKKGDEE